MLTRLKIPNALIYNGSRNFLAYCSKAFIQDRLYRRHADSESYRLDTLHAKQLAYPVQCRYGSSDFRVFRQIFLAGQYKPVPMSENVKLVVDCGTYIGYSIAYFLNKCPNAHVIAVEPDGINFELLKQNLLPTVGEPPSFMQKSGHTGPD